MKYTVYYCNASASEPVASYDMLVDAILYVSEQVHGCVRVNERDTDKGKYLYWYEIYEGEPVVVNDEGNEVSQDYVFTSEKYYAL